MISSKLVRFLPFGAGSLLFAVSAAAEPRRPTHIACVGDSITAGSGASSPAKNYPSLLQGLLGNAVQVKNFGHSGATLLGQGYGDLPYVQQSEYTAATDFVANAGVGAIVSVVVILGANDSKPYNWDQSGKPEQYLKDYRAMVDHFAGLASKPVVYVAYPLATGNSPCCDIRGNVIHDQQLPLIKQLAMEKHLPIIDLNTPTTNHPEYFGDGVHPNDDGYVVMANAVKKGLDRVPMVAIQSPTMGATVAAVKLTANASADTVGISSVEFFEGQTSLGKVTAEPFTLMWTAANGAHTVTAKAVDTTLASATSMPVTFTVGEAAAGGGGSGGASAGAPNGGAAGGGAAGDGAAGAGAASGGAAGGGAASGGAASGGAANGGTGAATAGSSAANGGAGSGALPTTPPSMSSSADSGCSCALAKTQAPAGKASFLLLAWLLAWRNRRRHFRDRCAVARG